jgi:hypothetical protein
MFMSRDRTLSVIQLIVSSIKGLLKLEQDPGLKGVGVGEETANVGTK